MSIEFITIMLLRTLEISIRGKHRILMRSVLSADKHRILMRRFIDIKSLHVMYYRPFDRSYGLINEFLKAKIKHKQEIPV